MKITIGIVDDHRLFVKSLTLLLEASKLFEVVIEATDGRQLQEKMSQKNMVVPDIMLIDVDMPKMNGYDTTKWLSKEYPQIKLTALSMNEKDHVIIEMIKSGCCAYLLKDTDPEQFEKALVEIHAKGYYNGDASNINFRRLLIAEKEMSEMNITDKEKTFIQLACSELTYKEIAVKMQVGERSVDNFRDIVFEKLKVQSRVGMCLEAIRLGLAKIDK